MKIFIIITSVILFASCKRECQDPNNWVKTTYDQNYVNVFFSTDVNGFTEAELDSVIVTNAANDTFEMFKLAPFPLRNAKLLQIGWRNYTAGAMKIYNPFNNQTITINNVQYDHKENKACESDYYVVKNYEVNGSTKGATDTLWVFKF